MGIRTSLLVLAIVVGVGPLAHAQECRHGMSVALQAPSPDAPRCTLSQLPELVHFFCMDPADPVCRFLRDEVAERAQIQCLRTGQGSCASVVERTPQPRGQEGERSYMIAWDDGQALDGALRNPRYTDDPVALRVVRTGDRDRALIFDPRTCPECAYKGPVMAQLVSLGIPKTLKLQNQHVTFDPKQCTVSAQIKAKGSVYTVKSLQLAPKACAAEKKYWAK